MCVCMYVHVVRFNDYQQVKVIKLEPVPYVKDREYNNKNRKKERVAVDEQLSPSPLMVARRNQLVHNKLRKSVQREHQKGGGRGSHAHPSFPTITPGLPRPPLPMLQRCHVSATPTSRSSRLVPLPHLLMPEYVNSL